MGEFNSVLRLRLSQPPAWAWAWAELGNKAKPANLAEVGVGAELGKTRNSNNNLEITQQIQETSMNTKPQEIT